ncbi:SRPBCC family protein [Primorskyibacter sp. S187A]|uniref:SRPBCC family protein n=1 Tax=Primorskyibacter sp. S187A TaxID=3415130 RepID=UPI003C7A5A93
MTFSHLSKTPGLAVALCVLSLGGPAPAQSACDAALTQGNIAQTSATHATIQTSILIDATPAEVWKVLTNFGAMSAWSTTTLQDMTGDIRDGGQVEITFLFGQDESGAPIVNKIPHQLMLQEGVSFGWSDPFPTEIGGGHDNHAYTVQSCGDKTLFLQTDEIVDNPYAANFVAQLLPLYQTFNAELKAAVES